MGIVAGGDCACRAKSGSQLPPMGWWSLGLCADTGREVCEQRDLRTAPPPRRLLPVPSLWV